MWRSISEYMWATIFGTVGSLGLCLFSYYVLNPDYIAQTGVRAYIRADGKSSLAEFLFKCIYVPCANLHIFLRGSNPAGLENELARVLWMNEDPAGARFQVVVENMLAETVTYSAYSTLFSEIKGSYSSWQEIGFQGKDPSTDFRGSGILGLKLLHSLSKQDTFDSLLVESRTSATSFDRPCYPLALVSIRLAQRLGVCVTKSRLISHILFRVQHEEKRASDESVAFSELEPVHRALVMQFHALWKQRVESKQVKSIMDVDSLLAEFEEDLVDRIAGI